MNKFVLITIKKELRSIFRDKKTILTMFLFPLLIPMMIVLYGTMYENIEEESTESTYTIGVNYDVSAYEKELLDNLNINYQTFSDSTTLKSEYENNNIEGYITYDKDKQIYTIYTDTSSNNGMILNTILEEYLNSYNQYLTDLYLLEHNINLEEAYNHFTINYEELSNSNYMLNIILTICFTYIIMAICMATSNMATGVTATERENGTLETILTFPIKKTDLLKGKYFASVIIGFIASLVSLALTFFSLLIAKHTYTMFEEFVLLLNWKTILGSLFIITSASIFIACVALALTTYARTYKEAQSSVSILNMVSVIPMFVSLLEVTLNKAYYLIPICNYEQILMELFTNQAHLTNLLITIASTVIYVFIILTYIIKSYKSEKILFTK